MTPSLSILCEDVALRQADTLGGHLNTEIATRPAQLVRSNVIINTNTTRIEYVAIILLPAHSDGLKNTDETLVTLAMNLLQLNTFLYTSPPCLALG